MSKAIAIVAIIGVVATATLLILKPPFGSKTQEVSTSTLAVVTSTIATSTVATTSTSTGPVYSTSTKPQGQSFWSQFFFGTKKNTTTVTSTTTKSSISKTSTKKTTVKPKPTPKPLPTTFTFTDKEIPAGFTRVQMSPYFKWVKMSVSHGSASSNSTITLTSSYPSGATSTLIDVTGWLIMANHGSAEVPKAINLYMLDAVNVPTDIMLVNGGKIVISSGTNPIGDYYHLNFSNANNIRLNKCIGYLGTLYGGIPGGCPKADPGNIDSFSGKCQNFIHSIGCRTPTVKQLNSFMGQGEQACYAFLTTLNYTSCVYKHRPDSDFFGKEWRVWTNHNFPDFLHDKINLFDSKGLLVSQVKY